MRHWRRSRRTATLGEVLEDAYIALLAVVMLGSMAVNVVINVADLTDAACRSSRCTSDRVLLAWVATGGMLAGCWAVARALGPVHVSPGAASWLLAAPVDRGQLLRTRLWGLLAITALVVLPVSAAAATLAGFGATAVLGLCLGAGAACALGTGALAHRQVVGRHPASLLVPATLLAVWCGLVLVALGWTPGLATPHAPGPAAWAVVAALVAGVCVVVCLASPLTRRMRRTDVAPGGALVPSLGGALAGLDLALMYDVLVAHGSRSRQVRRPVRGGPTGLGALAWRDVVRLRRRPGTLLLVAGSVALPYAVDALGGGRVLVVVVVLTGFLVGLPTLVGLRVLGRSAGMQRMFPTSVTATRATAMLVPGTLLVLHGLACAWALRDVAPSWGDAVVVSIACGLGGLAAGVRWVCGRPPDYGRPLVSSPAGAVPTNLYGSMLRGFDIALLVAAPMLVSPGEKGAVVSLAISLVTLGHLASRR